MAYCTTNRIVGAFKEQKEIKAGYYKSDDYGNYCYMGRKTDPNTEENTKQQENEHNYELYI